MIKVFVVVLIIVAGGSFWWWRKGVDRELVLPKQKIVQVKDGTIVLGARTKAETVGQLLKQSDIKLAKEDFVYPKRNVKINGGMVVQIIRTVPVVVRVDGQIIRKRVFAQTVRDALTECGVKLNPSDKIEPKLASLLTDNEEIIVTRIDHEEVVEMEEVEFKVIEKRDGSVKWQTKKIKQKGKKGKKEIKYLVTYKNGKEIKRKKRGEKIIEEPKDEIVVIGTKIKIGKVQKGRASWYAYTGKMTAASTTFSKGTWLRVTAIGSGKQVFVQVNDYGPSPETGKILDLDKVAFRKLAPLGAGVIKVKVEEIK